MSKTYEIDETSLLNLIDETLINLDLSVLEKARQECLKNNESTEIIDKAIREKQSRNRIITEKNTELSNKKEITDDFSDVAEYEPYNLEEEELEEDDFHYEDLD